MEDRRREMAKNQAAVETTWSERGFKNFGGWS
jgi:hypothetical protein